jgi:hypothetical protein
MIDEEKTFKFITSGDDNSIILYDIIQKKVVGRGRIAIIDSIEGMKG